MKISFRLYSSSPDLLPYPLKKPAWKVAIPHHLTLLLTHADPLNKWKVGALTLTKWEVLPHTWSTHCAPHFLSKGLHEEENGRVGLLPSIPIPLSFGKSVIEWLHPWQVQWRDAVANLV